MSHSHRASGRESTSSRESSGAIIYPRSYIADVEDPRTASFKPYSINEDAEPIFNDHKLWKVVPIGCLPLSAQLFMQKFFTGSNAFVFILICMVIGFGAVNRVLYKIQLVPMKPFVIFISDVLSFSYVFIYSSILFARWWLGIATTDMIFKPRFPFIDYKFVLMGLSDATGNVMGIFAAREISGFLLTLLPQGTVPMTMIITIILLKARYNWGQVLGAFTLVAGIILTLVPQLSGGKAGGSIAWAVVYFFSSAPAAFSFTLKEMVFSHRPDMDIFVVNTMDSWFQMFFTLLYLPLVAAPGFGEIPFDGFGTYIHNGFRCMGGSHVPTATDPHHSCYGMPYLTIIYVCVNISWNISILVLVKKGGAVLTFIALAVSLPLANLAFIIDWPILGSGGFDPWDLAGLVTVLGGLVIYRVFSILQKRKKERIQRAMTDTSNNSFVSTTSITSSTRSNHHNNNNNDTTDLLLSPDNNRHSSSDSNREDSGLKRKSF
eukprot:TRINITY_DN2497_c0_g1_i1.p1 TRINITY_DN2497_c0_g1~~TRINITY_DN2497_c0_g1_i1.p1  ORF type:complete len:490 (+),score=76.24 TRINITY_DN2497_c0_g1_i1:159-1628(+)